MYIFFFSKNFSFIYFNPEYIFDMSFDRSLSVVLTLLYGLSQQFVKYGNFHTKHVFGVFFGEIDVFKSSRKPIKQLNINKIT